MKPLIYLSALVLTVSVGCKKENPDSYVDQPKDMEITCVNNLKQIALAFRSWEGDHKDKNPFDVSTNEGGVMELVVAKDGQRQNGYLIFQCISNELTSPLLLVCPQDKSKVIAKNWSSLSADNISYHFPDTNGVILVCPLDGDILYDDGTVLEKSTGKHSL